MNRINSYYKKSSGGRIAIIASSVLLLVFANNGVAEHLTENTTYTALNHMTSGRIIGDILPPVPGDGIPANRVEYEYKLYKGEIQANSQSESREVYFTITDTSDLDFAERFGVMHSDELGRTPSEATENARFFDNGRDGRWKFSSDPGLVSRMIGGQLRGPRGNRRYSPIKKIVYDPDGAAGPEAPRNIIINAPMIKWGDGPGQMLLIDAGGCDPLIRRNPASELLEGGGPKDCENDPVGDPLARYTGGQLTGIDFEAGTVRVKLHLGIFKPYLRFYAYYTAFESSTAPAAEMMGVVHAPKLENARRGESVLGTVTHLGNGLPTPKGGPSRFQPGIISYPGTVEFYTPIWHIRHIYWDLDQDGDGQPDGVVLDNECNRSFGDIVDESLCGNKVAPGITFDPWQVHNGLGQSIKHAEFAPDDPILSDQRFPDGMLEVIMMGRMVDGLIPPVFTMTDSPGGRLFNDENLPHIVNCPAPVTVLPTGQEEGSILCVVDSDCPTDYTCLGQEHGHGRLNEPRTCFNFNL